MKQRLPFYIALLILIMSCGSSGTRSVSKPSWVLDEAKMVDVITDLRIADAAVYINSNSPPRDKAKDWAFIMKKHQISDSLFRKSHDYYAEHPDQAVAIYEKVIDRLNEMVAANQDN